jgi:peptidoglycan hydrolase-like protein with peptidoglycan-binding domain
MKQGMIGVGSLHQQLLEAGETIEKSELDTGAFGPSTLAAVRHFQASHVDERGHALQEDGMVGPSSIWALMHPNAGYANARLTAPGWRAEPSVMREAIRPVMLAAIGEIGVREQPDGSNSGPRVDVFTAPQRGSFGARRSRHGVTDKPKAAPRSAASRRAGNSTNGRRRTVASCRFRRPVTLASCFAASRKTIRTVIRGLSPA